MAELKNIKLFSTEGLALDDAALSADFRAAEKIGPFWVGRRAFFYRDGLRKYCIPFGRIDNVFTRVQPVPTHCCCGKMDFTIFRMVVCSGGEEIADVRTEDEKLVDRAQALLKERIPGLRVGYTKPA